MTMLSETQRKSGNYLCIVSVLKYLRDSGHIDQKQYDRAKKYYKGLTGSDLVIAD